MKVVYEHCHEHYQMYYWEDVTKETVLFLPGEVMFKCLCGKTLRASVRRLKNGEVKIVKTCPKCSRKYKLEVTLLAHEIEGKHFVREKIDD